MSRLINININVRNAKMIYIVKRREYSFCIYFSDFDIQRSEMD
jgi:hypothetical protein